jgi:hypothetical protein
MSYDSCCRIERATNGYTVNMQDPKIREANSKSGGKYKDPNCEFVFETIEDVLAFLKKNLDKALVADSYSTSFTLASVDADKD